MSESVTLSLPVAPAYRSIALDLARKYVEVAGASASDAGAAADALSAAIDRVTGAAVSSDADANVALTFSRGRADVELHVRFGEATEVVRHPCVFSTR